MGNQQNSGSTRGTGAYGRTYQSGQPYATGTHQQSHSPYTQPAPTHGQRPGQNQVYFPDGSQGDPSAPPGYLSPYANYDTEPPVMASKHRQSWYDWMTGKPPILTSPAELRDERYVSYMMSMHKIFLDYEHGILTKEQALQYVEHYMAKVREIGHVDDERTSYMLEQQGFTFQERADMQREYEDLKLRCGQKVHGYKQGSGYGSDTPNQGQGRRTKAGCF